MSLIPRKRMSSDLLDPKPKKGSFNGVTSDGVYEAIGEATDNILDDGSTSESIVVAVPSSQSSNYIVGNYYRVLGKIARLCTKTEGDNVTQLTFDTTSGVIDAVNGVIEDISSIGSPLQWKGPATVAQLNAGITGIQPGWTYTLTDAGTLTDGSVAVDVGDEVAWTGTAWFKVGGETSKIAVFKFADTAYPLVDDMNTELMKGKDIVLIRTGYPTSYDVFYLTHRVSGSGHIRMTFTGTSEILDVEDDVWTVTKQALNGVKNGGSVAQIDGHASVKNNALTTITGVNVAALEVSVLFGNGSTEVPNFALEIDPTVDCTLTLKRYIGSSPLTLTPSVAGGNVMTAGKHYQVTCVGNCWTLAEFAMPNP